MQLSRVDDVAHMRLRGDHESGSAIGSVRAEASRFFPRLFVPTIDAKRASRYRGAAPHAKALEQRANVLRARSMGS
jgi:hypothetical protein